MPKIWGGVTEIRDLGEVAEQCPQCQTLMPCLLRSVSRGSYLFFVRTTAPTMERSALCTGCLRAFPCEHWRYAAVVPIQQAKSLPLEDLLARTNPALAERQQMREQVSALGGDARFTFACEQLEGMRPGALRSCLLQRLLAWERLPEDQRASLGQQIGAQTRAWQLARQIAPGFPGHAGCLTLAALAFVVGAVFAWFPEVRNWLWGTITVAAALGAAAIVNHLLFTRWVSHWTRSVLIPAADDANICLRSFVAVIDDVPGSRLGLSEEVWPIKDQLETIRAVLAAEGKL